MAMNLGKIAQCEGCKEYFVGFGIKCDDCLGICQKQPSKEATRPQQEVFCRVYIFVQSARGLPNMDSGADHRSDCYTVCTVPGKKALNKSTEVVKDCLNPVWNKEVRFRGTSSKDVINFDIWDKDDKVDELVGKTTLTPEQWFPRGFDDTLPLVNEQGPVEGVLAVKVQPTFPYFVNVAVSHARWFDESSKINSEITMSRQVSPGTSKINSEIALGLFCVVRLLGPQSAQFRTEVNTRQQPVWRHGGQFPAVYIEDSPFVELEVYREEIPTLSKSMTGATSLAVPGTGSISGKAVESTSLGKAWLQVTDEGFEGEVELKVEGQTKPVGLLSVQVDLEECNKAGQNVGAQKSLSAALSMAFITRDQPHPDNHTSMPGGLVVGRQDAVRSLVDILGTGVRICVLGGTKFYGKDSEAIVVGMASMLAKEVSMKDVVYVTGGMPGIQEAFAKSIGDAKNLFNLVTVGEASNFGVGEDMQAGANLPERREVFGFLGDIYITVEGGPGVAQEALFAQKRGAIVVPLIRTGAASAGGFGFPPEALEAPEHAQGNEWELLGNTEAPVDDTVVAAVSLIKGFVARVKEQRVKEMRSR